MPANLGFFENSAESLAEGATLLRGFALEQASELMDDLKRIIAAAPLRHMVTPGGFTMSVAMTNCGLAGWITDRKGYRYASHDPLSNQPWPAMPPAFAKLATNAAAEAGFKNFHPDACLVNRYEPGARMTLHQDKNEIDFNAPIVSVSLGLPAVFLFGGPNRTDKAQRIPLRSGDVVVWGGPSRLFFHGINPLKDGDHPLTGRCRYNLTFRLALP
jgi:alkylated DNA repair protein (DNA oxidative demethylase)